MRRERGAGGVRGRPAAANRPFLRAGNSGIIGLDAAVGTTVVGMANRPDDLGPAHSGQVVTKTREKTDKPSMYKVLLLNDDYTPMEFVVHVLERFFGKNRDDAQRIMLHVHNHGVGICGVYTYEVAETKVSQVIEFARQNQHPLQCTMEKD
jgi:ATP-dependent Clp protease adaptor protein ClpS